MLQGSVFETLLSPDMEEKFQRWKLRYAHRDTGEDYDLRGAFVAGCVPDNDGHWPDLFKKPNHPTFSNQSIYAKYFPSLAGSWDGDRFIGPSGTAESAQAATAGGAGEMRDESLRDRIVGALIEYSGSGQGVDEMLYAVADGQATLIIKALSRHKDDGQLGD